MFKISLLSDLKVLYYDIMGCDTVRFSRFSPRCARHLLPPATTLHLQAAGLLKMLVHTTKLETSNWLTTQLTQLERIRLQKLLVPQLVKMFRQFNETRMFITSFTTARHTFASWARSVQSTPSSYFRLLILTLAPINAYVFQVVASPQVFPLPHMCHIPYTFHSS
jgi:hypothetical protein